MSCTASLGSRVCRWGRDPDFSATLLSLSSLVLVSFQSTEMKFPRGGRKVSCDLSPHANHRFLQAVIKKVWSQSERDQ